MCCGLGVTLLPYSIYEKYADDELFDYFEIPQKFGLVQTVFIYHKQEYLSANITKFIELFKTDKNLLTTPLLK